MEYRFTLCAGRHDTPAEKAIFQEIADPMATNALYKQANAAIPADATKLVVYVTGLTTAMLAVVQVCFDRGITLVAMNYDREVGEYLPQDVLWFDHCVFCGSPKWGDFCPRCGAN